MILLTFMLFLPAVLSQFEIMKIQGQPIWEEERGGPDDIYVEANMQRLFGGSRRDTRRQFAPMSLQPDVAFGDNNDRFDLTGVYKQHKHKFREGNDADRRRFLPQVSRRSGSRVQPNYRRYEEWLEDMIEAGDRQFPDVADGSDYRRHRRGEKDVMTEGHDPPPKEREILLKYALPIRIRVRDLVNGTFITGINLL